MGPVPSLGTSSLATPSCFGTWAIFLFKRRSHEVGEGDLEAKTGNRCRTGEQSGEGTHLVAADVEPPGLRVQGHDLVDHGSNQCQGLRLVGVQGVGEKCHFSEVGQSLVLQHKLRRDGRRELGDTGQKLAPELPAARDPCEGSSRPWLHGQDVCVKAWGLTGGLVRGKQNLRATKPTV